MDDIKNFNTENDDTCSNHECTCNIEYNAHDLMNQLKIKDLQIANLTDMIESITNRNNDERFYQNLYCFIAILLSIIICNIAYASIIVSFITTV